MANDSTARIWDRMAPRYDRDMRRLEPLLFGRDARPWVCAQASGDVLEVAIGTGLNLPHYPPGVRLTGVDLSPVMLAAAAKRAADLGLTVDLSEADAEHLPFDDASFDTVVCTLSLCSVADERAAIAEMHRVLRPGGQLLLLDHVAATNRLLLALQRLWEKITLRFAGDYQTRHPLPLVERVGLVVQDSRRSKAGTVERLRAVKPAT
jgi:ubiquinone/menaquinone biosynthesis C-methylase UbiE